MSDIKPALTAEEWQREIRAQAFTGHDALRPDGALSYDDYLGAERKHAIAAAYLHGQSFGFTWEDVDQLRGAIEQLESEYGGPADAELRSLADRIAALLPPR